MFLIKGIYIIALTLFSIFPISCWGLFAPSDIPISDRDIRGAGIPIPGAQGPKQSETMVIRHVISTGQNQVNKQQYLFISIKNLEQIKPKFKAFQIIQTSQQYPLTNEQTHSLAQQLRQGHLPPWLLDEQQKKYINVVFQEKNCPHCPISAISTENANRLVHWAIKNKRLLKEDHPQ